MFGFGGVLPWARRMVVEQKRWLSATEFTDMLGLCQFLPGGNVMNVTIALGARFHGVAGCGGGLRRADGCARWRASSHWAWCTTVTAQLPTVRHAFAGLAAAASALVLANALRIAAPLRSRPLGLAVAIATLRRDRGVAAAAAAGAAGDDGAVHAADVAFRR